MTTFISFLRGINVSGQKKIPMKDLKAALQNTELNNLKTYIQSGNLVFKSPKKKEHELSNLISNSIQNKFGFDVPVITFKYDELVEKKAKNPFLNDEHDEKGIYYTFMYEIPENEKIDQFKNLDLSPEKYYILDRLIYLYYPNGYGRSKHNNNFIENKLKITATTRNNKTVTKMIELAETL